MLLKDKLQKSINKADKKIQHYSGMSRRMSVFRLLIAMAGFVLVITALYYRSELLSWLSVLAFIFVFTLAAKLHDKIRLTISKFENWNKIKQQHLDRQNLNWQALPEFENNLPANHPFARDLDICGPFSLHRLLNNCVSQEGGKQLLNWLSNAPQNPELILTRQALVKELIPLNYFRDKVTLLGISVDQKRLHARRLMNWLNKENEHKMPGFVLTSLISLAILTLLLAALFYFAVLPAYFSLSLILYIGLFFAFGKHISSLLNDVILLDDELRKIASILKYLEKFRFSNKPHLADLLQSIQSAKNKPTRIFSRLNRLLILIGLRSNAVIAVALNLVFPIDFILVRRLEAFKKKLAAVLPDWYKTFHTLDALSALANFAYLQPEFVFPNFETENTQVEFEEMGHPLIAEKQRICNSLQLNENQKLALITGSNMSGKSTFLRTIGCNLALAFSGSVVCAKSLNTSLLRLHSCIRIDDALDQGLSYFYAEVKRLKSILDATSENENLPVFYLVDEIFKGTNNRERLAGSQAYINALIHASALGLVSSHDLELTRLEETLKGLKNFHFEELIKDGKMHFDYKLRSGPSPSTNALKIMELEGLPV